MSARKNRRPMRLPAIVPRFIKSAVTIGAIPALVGCDKGRPQQRVQPVVAQYIDKSPPVVAAYDAPLQPEVAPVVAAMVTDQPPPPPRPRDAGVDAAPKKKLPKPIKAPTPVVAALVGPPQDFHPPPAVVAAMLPQQNLVPQPSPNRPKKP
jgi:S-DNA-T family DNA segregation ATPase FtsK/SpoIIIE